ncbi:MAG: glycosyltransferase family 2 protein [Candidatus Thorarchaeota archaeon]
MNLKSLYIIIPVHNRKLFTRECLLSLRNQTCKEFNVIVIDDGSTDGTEEMINSEFPEVILLKGDGDLWWAGATNLGVKYALAEGAKYVLTFNDDTVATSNFIEKMFYWSNKYPRALLGALSINIKNNKLYYGGELGNWKKANSIKLLDILSDEKKIGIHKVSHFPGRGLFIPAEVFLKIGFYDQKNFPQSLADDDFSFRAVENGYEIFCNYDSTLYVHPDSYDKINFSFSDYYNHLFGIKGKGNLIFFNKFVLKHCPKKFLIFALIQGNSRRIFGYPFAWIKKILGKILNYENFKTYISW